MAQEVKGCIVVAAMLLIDGFEEIVVEPETIVMGKNWLMTHSHRGHVLHGDRLPGT
jgi:hypothetical protein